MILNITVTLKAADETTATIYSDWINTNYGTYVIYNEVMDSSRGFNAGIFPTQWAVKARLEFPVTAWADFKNAIGNIIDNHYDKIFSCSFNTAKELE